MQYVLEKSKFFENLIPISLEPEAEPMKYQTLQAKRQFRTEQFYQIRMANKHDFDITTHADFASSIFRGEPVSKNARFAA